MAQKKTNKAKAGQSTGNNTTDFVSEATDTARRGYDQAMRSGQKLQEQAGEWWTRMLSQMGNASEWQRQMTSFTRVATDAMPMAQRRMEEMMGFIESSSRANAEVARKAIEAAQSPCITEAQQKWLEVWTSSMKAMQSHLESAADLSTKALDSWIAFVRTNMETGRQASSRAA